MRVFGIIGFPLEHSWSARFFNEKFQKEYISDAVYKTFPIENTDGFPALLGSEPHLTGLNVTSPHKEKIIPFLDVLKGVAFEINSVNVISFEKKEKGFKLIGHNTDVDGFRESLIESGADLSRKALVLGTGGASKAVKWALKELACKYLSVSRSPGAAGVIGYDDLSPEIMANHTLIINTTPLGMLPQTATCPPIPYHLLSNHHTLFDLVYNPPETLFLKKGKAQGCRIINGEKMLYAQARKAWEIWNR